MFKDTVSDTVLMEWELEDRFDAHLNDIYPLVEIGPFDFLPSLILKKIDTDTYNSMYKSWLAVSVELGELESI